MYFNLSNHRDVIVEPRAKVPSKLAAQTEMAETLLGMMELYQGSAAAGMRDQVQLWTTLAHAVIAENKKGRVVDARDLMGRCSSEPPVSTCPRKEFCPIRG